MQKDKHDMTCPTLKIEKKTLATKVSLLQL